MPQRERQPAPSRFQARRVSEQPWLSSTSSTPSFSTSRGWPRLPRRAKASSSEAATALAGAALAGTLRWTLFEQPGELVCAMSPTLRIETRDGAEIRAEGRGFGARDGTESSGWRVAATLRFRSDDARYALLDGALGLWEASSTRNDTAPATARTSSPSDPRKERP